MDKLIKKVISKLEKNGYEAYIIGGYVRDLLLGINSFDIDITTNATPKELKKLFPKSSNKNLGGIDFKIKEYHFEITTYRSEIEYKNRRPVKYIYINNLLEDLKRRDFTINTILMNKNGVIIDYLNAIEDLNNLVIKSIGDQNSKLEEDPLRILRGIRFATILNFNIDSSLYQAMKNNYKSILTLSNTRIKEELDKILISNNVLKGLDFLNDLGISRLLGLKYSNIVPINNLEGMYAQLDIDYNLPFTKEEKNNILVIKNILKTKKIDNETLYYNGYYTTRIASIILNYNQDKLTKIYKELPIHDKKEIDINAEDIINSNIDCYKINKIMNHLEKKIINKELKNEKNELLNYININRNEW